MVHLENRLSTHLHYAIIKAQIANLEKLTDLSEEALSLISGDYSPYSKVWVWPVKYIEVNGMNVKIGKPGLNREYLYLNYSLQKN